MEFTYKKAALADIDILTKTRIEVLRVVYELSNDADMFLIEKESYEYYLESLKEGSHIGYLVFDGDKFVGTGGVSFYKVMPTYDNPTGLKAYVMNMYTKPEYRRKGIALKTLDLVVQDAKSRGSTFISLEASEMGKLLYSKYGFVKMEDEMILLK